MKSGTKFKHLDLVTAANTPYTIGAPVASANAITAPIGAISELAQSSRS